MTVRQLIQQLNQMPQDLTVYINRGPWDVNEIQEVVYEKDDNRVDLFE